MGRIAIFLGSVFATAYEWFSKYLFSKVALVGAVSVASLAAIVAFYAALKLLIVGCVAAVPNETFRMAFYACWPSNAETCVAACWGADVAAFVYKYRARLMMLVGQ